MGAGGCVGEEEAWVNICPDLYDLCLATWVEKLTVQLE